MILQVVAYRPEHVGLVRVQQAQVHEASTSAPPAEAGPAWSVFAGSQCICVAGLAEMFPHRAYAWALLSEGAGRHMLALTREVRFRLQRAPFARIEMAVDRDFTAGRRWALMLGFELETPTPLKAYLPGPRDAWLYSRVK